MGKITSIGTETTIIYLGQNEWMTEYVPFASVTFETCEKRVPLKELIKEKRVRLYESLRPGDFIVFGKLKQARALVLHVFERRRRGRPYVTDIRVLVLEDGIKKSLSVQQDVTVIQRMIDD